MFLLGDLLNRLRVATRTKLRFIYVMNSKLNKSVLKVLYNLGYISGFVIINYKYLKVYLKYIDNCSCIRNIFLLSKPSSRIYFKYQDFTGKRLKNFYNINGFILCSTSYGILTDIECIMLRVGGEPLLFVY